MKVVTYRDALVVGVNQYLFLKDSKNKAKHLRTPASDAEAIAQRLEKYGGFKVRRLPESIQDGQRQVEANPPKPIDAETLENAIIQLFNPTGENIPQTALLYFIGHGLRKNRGGVTEGFLATSDVHPQRNQWGVSLRWLRELLQKSPVPQQIVWLDCCYSGELLNFTEADLGTAGQGQTRFLIAAAREFELAEEDIQGQHGVFSQALWGGLDPKQQPDGVVNNDRLIAHITQALKDIPQQPIWYNPNSEIILTGEQEEVFTPTPDGICPYKGLRFFDVEDAPYFYGREALTERLIERVQVGKANFLAVLGVSGSGKSSLLRAGLMYQLQQKRRLPGTELWKIRFFTPGAQPLVGLATAFLDEEVTDIERAKQLKEAEEAVLGGEGLARLIKVSKFPRTLLIVDQFEEVFTVCQSQTDRQKFIFTLLDALKETGDKLCLIFAMRDDFLGKCATYWELADLMQNNLVIVTPMNTEELRRAIIEPAKKLGCKIEENLINTIFKDLRVVIPHLYAQNELMLSEPEPGFLPLLSYTLEQLWQRKTLNWLKLDSYIQLGGVQKTLENLAEDVYKSFLPEEQRIANQIFIKLTQLGDGAPDTRKQVAQQDLVTEPKSTALIERVIQKLVQAKLIITSEQRKGNKKVAVVDVSHEVLIRHWSRLRELLDSNRGNIKTERKIQFAAEEWQDKGKPNDFTYLLQGEKLVEAENFLYQKVEFVHLSVLAHEFVQISQLQRDKDKVARDRERKLTLLRTVFSMGFVIIAGWLIWQFLISFKLNKDLDKLKQQISGALPIKGTENFTFKNIVVNNKMVWMSVYNHENKGLG
ncbi:caspase family protein, partial [Dolichospermum sp. LEGE 00246]|uniref:nSTAND1 domain-containing NTPase n=1 Tax=Dolichospermum sp. LEGE 00246 TaxID=1828605 RepID=UPI00187FA502